MKAHPDRLAETDLFSEAPCRLTNFAAMPTAL